MGKRLFITEKPSVARDFAKALHVNGGGKDGYIEDDKIILTWCVGHLVTMSYPEKYDPDLKSWKLDTLPFLPKTFKYEVIESVAKQFGIVKTQIEREDVDHIYYSGDAAREGEYIQRLVRQFCNIGSNVEERRVWIDYQTEEEIQRGIREAKLLSEYDLISDAGYMRAIEDYLFGINLSRAYTLKFGRLYNNIVGNTNNEVIAAGRALPRVPGLPDEAFIRGKTPMPKQEVRAAALAKLAVAPTDTLWDVGAGTGSVSVEMALAAPMGQVYAVECDADACALVRQNQAKFAASNLTLIAGKAPEALQNLPAPDAVFIGGSKGNMQAIVDAALAANPQTRLCIAAIALETLQQSIAALAAHGLAAQVTQIAVSRSKAAGSLHLMMANNPVFLIVRE